VLGPCLTRLSLGERTTAARWAMMHDPALKPPRSGAL